MLPLTAASSSAPRLSRGCRRRQPEARQPLAKAPGSVGVDTVYRGAAHGYRRHKIWLEEQGGEGREASAWSRLVLACKERGADAPVPRKPL